MKFYPPIYNNINWSELFANGIAPSVLDIGAGRGGAMMEYALLHPEINILGVELRWTAVDWVNEVIAGEKISNAKMLWYTVANRLPFIDDNSIDSIFYLFPDPWPKNRHAKRRAFTVAFLEELYTKLKPNGKLYLATDVPLVDEYQQEVLKEFGKFSFKYVNEDEWIVPTTDQQDFCLKKDIPFIRMVCEKVCL